MLHGSERTDPAWIHQKTFSRTVHKHYLFGRPVLRSRPALDEHGNHLCRPVMTEATLEEAMYPWSCVPPQVQAMARLLRSRGGELTDSIRYESYPRMVYDRVEVGRYADFCTAGMGLKGRRELRDHPGLYAPCEARPTRFELRKTTPFHSDRFSDRPYLSRSTDRIRSHRIALAFNAGVALDDLD